MKKLEVNELLEPFVKDILLIEGNDPDAEVSMPIYADGFPGIIYGRSDVPFVQQPLNKTLPDFYLYGQTIEPITLNTNGKFQLIVFQLFPFAVRILLGISPSMLKDDCFDLIEVEGVDTGSFLKRLKTLNDVPAIIAAMPTYFDELLKNASLNHDHRIKLATNIILKRQGMITIKTLREQLGIGERTFERHFYKEIGVTPKQFAQIIQFHSSMDQITEAQYINLTDVGYDNGFADQSHFIRTFKKYAGKSPSEFQRQLRA